MKTAMADPGPIHFGINQHDERHEGCSQGKGSARRVGGETDAEGRQPAPHGHRHRTRLKHTQQQYKIDGPDQQHREHGKDRPIGGAPGQHQQGGAGHK